MSKSSSSEVSCAHAEPELTPSFLSCSGAAEQTELNVARAERSRLKRHYFAAGTLGLFMERWTHRHTCRQKVFKSATSPTPNARTSSPHRRSFRTFQTSRARYVMRQGTFPLSRDLGHARARLTGASLLHVNSRAHFYFTFYKNDLN